MIFSDTYNLSLIGNGSWVNYCRKLSSYRRIKHRPRQTSPEFHYSYNRFLYSRQPGQHPVHPNDCHRSGHPCGDVVQFSRNHFSKKVPADYGKNRQSKDFQEVCSLFFSDLVNLNRSSKCTPDNFSILWSKWQTKLWFIQYYACFYWTFIENRLGCGELFLNLFLSKWKLIFQLINMKITTD